MNAPAPGFYLLEGPDGTGKSTLAAALVARCRDMGIPVYHRHHGPFPDARSMWNVYLTGLVVARGVVARGGVAIFDRAWPSEKVYGEALRGVDRLARDYRQLERIALGARGLLVLCDPGRRIALSAWRARHAAGGELLTNLARYHQVYGAYQLFSRTYLPTFTYNYQRAPELDQFIAASATRLTRFYGSFADTYRGYRFGTLGRFAPGRTVLLVAERPGPDESRRDLPLVSDRGCAPWLAAELEAADIGEDALTWVNALNARGRPAPAAVIDELDPLAVVALGKVAAAWADRVARDELRIPVRELPIYTLAHPQHHRRFHYREPYPLGKILARVFATQRSRRP